MSESVTCTGQGWERYLASRATRTSASSPRDLHLRNESSSELVDLSTLNIGKEIVRNKSNRAEIHIAHRRGQGKDGPAIPGTLHSTPCPGILSHRRAHARCVQMAVMSSDLSLIRRGPYTPATPGQGLALRQQTCAERNLRNRMAVQSDQAALLHLASCAVRDPAIVPVHRPPCPMPPLASPIDAPYIRAYPSSGPFHSRCILESPCRLRLESQVECGLENRRL